MIPASFDYHAPKTLPEALALLGQLGDEAKILSGGQSLLPLLKLRFAQPAHLVDIGRIPGLDYIKEEGGVLKIGALVREAAARGLRRSCGRGTRSSPTPRPSSPTRSCATWPPCAATSPTAIPPTTTPPPCSPSGPRWWLTGPKGTRTIPIAQFFTGLFTTALAARRRC